MIEATITVRHPVGLHARPAAVFAKTAQGYQAKVTVRNVTRDTRPVDAKSILSIFKAAVAKDHTIHITADGADEHDALTALVKLIEDNFGE
ncbi:MAG: HPr family phosphocarrier protein [Chloroflexota bacterium]